MKNPWCDGDEVKLDGYPITETSTYVYLGRSMNMENDMKEELDRRRRAAWAAFGPLKEVTDQLTDPKLRAHLFDSTVLPALCYAAETWTDTSATSRTLRTTHRALERSLVKIGRLSQRLHGLRSSDIRKLSHLRDPEIQTTIAKHRWAGHIMRRTDDRWTKRTVEWTPREYKRPLGRPPKRWADVFVANVSHLYPQMLTSLESRNGPCLRHHARYRIPPWTTLARERNEWKFCCGSHHE